MTDELKGGLALIAGVALFSTVELVSKVIGSRVSPFLFVFIRFFVTGALLLLLAAPYFKLRQEPLKLKDYGIFALNGFVGIALSISIFHMAILIFEKASSCAVVFSANPIFTIIFARMINKEPWSARKLAAVAVGALGIFFFSWESGAFTKGSFTAMMVMMASAAAFALSICISRRFISRYGAFMLMGFSALFGSLMVLPFAVAGLMRDGAAGLVDAWLPVTYVVVAGTAVAYGCYYFGILNTSAYKASMTFFLKPVIAAVLAYIFLKERFNVYTVTGTVMILSGLVLTILPSRSKTEMMALEK